MRVHGCKFMLLFYFLAQHIIFSLQADAEIACNMWSLDFRFAQISMQHLPGKAGCVISLRSCPLNTARSLILPCPQRCKPQQLEPETQQGLKLIAGSVRKVRNDIAGRYICFHVAACLQGLKAKVSN